MLVRDTKDCYHHMQSNPIKRAHYNHMTEVTNLNVSSATASKFFRISLLGNKSIVA